MMFAWGRLREIVAEYAEIPEKLAAVATDRAKC